jgi:hypothetical protein
VPDMRCPTCDARLSSATDPCGECGKLPRFYVGELTGRGKLARACLILAGLPPAGLAVFMTLPLLSGEHYLDGDGNLFVWLFAAAAVAIFVAAIQVRKRPLVSVALGLSGAIALAVFMGLLYARDAGSPGTGGFMNTGTGLWLFSVGASLLASGLLAWEQIARLRVARRTRRPRPA